MMTASQINNFKNLLAQRESSGSYTAIYPPNASIENARAIGKYQFTPDTISLIANYLKVTKPSNLIFLSNPDMQELYMSALIQSNYNDIVRAGLNKYIGQPVVSKNTGKTATITINGLLAGAHLGGTTGLKSLLVNGYDGKDGNGTYVSEYIQSFSNANYQAAGFDAGSITTFLFLGLIVTFLIKGKIF